MPSLLADLRQEEVEEAETIPLDDVLAGVRAQSPNGSRAVRTAIGDMSGAAR